MINNSDFSKRLQKVIDHYNENASSFATKIGVQRSSISHILSGRNKPSLEFVLKILDTFPEVELYWLLKGKGFFPKKENIKQIPAPIKNEDLFSQKTEIKNTENNKPLPSSFDIDHEKEINNDSFKGKRIDRIVIFYKDGSFSNFQNL